jgi:tetratricopeptide (TPR) repeat protein
VTSGPDQLQRAKVMIDVGRFPDAITLLAPVIAAEPDNGVAWSLLAQAQIGADKPAAALAAANRAGELSPDTAWPHRLRSVAQRQTGRSHAAVDSAFEACKREPHDWVNHLVLAQAALGAAGYIGPGGMSSLAIAAQASGHARALAPNEASAHYVSGQVSRAGGDDQAALAYFERTLALDPEHSRALNELGRIRLRRGDSGAAAKHFVQAEAVYGQNVEIAVAAAERSVRKLVRWVIYGSWLLIVVAPAASQSLAGRIAVLAAVGVAVAVVAVVWRYQLRRMPGPARPLFQGRSMLLALGVALGALVLGVSAIEFLPGGMQGYWYLIVFMLAARFAAFKILSDGARKRYEQVTGGKAPARVRRA